jgi:hypothetical protein
MYFVQELNLYDVAPVVMGKWKKKTNTITNAKIKTIQETKAKTNTNITLQKRCRRRH